MLRIEGLCRRIGQFALRVDELRVNRGEYVVLLGSSGAGKTMLLETIAGLHPASGRVWIDGRDASRLPPESRAIGLVYQDCWLFPHLTVRENIDFGRRYRHGVGNDPAPHTNELADMLHISDLLPRFPRTLSGGERQRVALARALAIRPKVLLLDEPFGPLDPVNREHIASELRQLAATLGLTTIHVTHDHTEARMMGDIVAVMRQGTIEQVGQTEEVFQRPHTAQVARFLGCENLFEAEALPGSCAEMTQVRLANDISLMVHSVVRGKIVVCVRPEDLRIRTENQKSKVESRNLTGDSRVPNGFAGEDTGAAFNAIAASFSGRIAAVSQRGPLVRLEVETTPLRWAVLTATSEFSALGVGVNDFLRVDVPSVAIHLISAR